jgi:flavin reductase (DIM6/NTAB) family NADH-FMN oxidoreductase RutF
MDRRTFFDIMGTAPATVTVVTTLDASGRPRGLTVGAVTSVSAEPPSLLISLDHRSQTLGELVAAGRFAVNYLRGDRADVAGRFASRDGDRFDGTAWRPGAIGVPILYADSLSWLECRIEQVVRSGDHALLIGGVVAGSPPPPRSRPLMYFRHRYETWAGDVDDAEAAARSPGSAAAPGPEVTAAGATSRVRPATLIGSATEP